MAQVSFVCTRFRLLFGLSGMVCGTCCRLPAPWATRFLSQWMLHWWQDNASAVREPLHCTHQSTPSTRSDRPQMFFKCSVWPDRESNPAHQLWWSAVNQPLGRWSSAVNESLYSFNWLSSDAPQLFLVLRRTLSWMRPRLQRARRRHAT